MLEKAPYKFHDIQSHDTPPVAMRLFVGEKDLSVLSLEDTAV